MNRRGGNAATVMFLAALWMLTGCGGESAQYWMGRGIRCFQAHDYAGAVKAYRRALRIQPDNPVTHNLLGMAYRFHCNETGDPRLRRQEAAAFRRAMELNPRFLVAVKNLAATLHGMGDTAGAAGAARRALEIAPRDPERRVLLEWIRATGAKAPPTPAGTEDE